MNKKYQSGSAHLVITIILAVALIGTLGFVYWQNFIANNETAKVSDSTSSDNDKTDEQDKTPVSKNNIYSGTFYSFEYPKTGWEIKTEESGAVSLETPDYTTGPMGVEQGSSVTVSEIAGYNSASEMVVSYKAKGMIDSTESVKIDGQTGYKFSCSEFCLYSVVFDKDGKGYEVKFISKSEDNISVYQTVLDSLEVK